MGLWRTTHDSAFSCIKTEIAQKLKLSHRKEGYRLSLFTDASDTHWAAVLTQVPKSQLDMSIEGQAHEPLSFLSGSFTGSSFDHYGSNPSIGRHTASKLMRCALKLSAYKYVIEHLPGERNVWADMLTRWTVKQRSSVRAGKLASIMYASLTPSSSDELDWPERPL